MRARSAAGAGVGSGSRLAAAALLVGLAAAVPGGPLAAQRLPFTVFDADSGLPATQIWALRQDRRGFLWVATTWGLARYDGQSFATLSVPEGLPSPNVRTLLEDRQGRLWIGTNAGLARYDGRQIVAFDEPDVPRVAIWASALDRHGQLWFGTEVGLVVHHDGRFRRHDRASGLAGDYVYGLAADAAGALWIGFRGAGLTRCEARPGGELADCRSWRRAGGLAGDVVRAFAELPGGSMLVGTRDGGMTLFEDGALRTLRRADGLPSDDVYALSVGADGGLAIGTSTQGLALCAPLRAAGAPLRCRTITEANGLPDAGVRALLEDRERSIWVGTEGGLARLSQEEVWGYAESEGLPDRQVYALAADGAGLWVGTFGGLARLEVDIHGEPKVRVWRREQGLPGDWVWAVRRDRRGRLWVGTEAGLCRLDERGCERFGVDRGLPSDFVLAIAEGPHGELWVGTTDGLARLDDDGSGARVSRVYGRADGLLAARAYALEVDGAGRLWVAHTEGLSWFDGERFHAVTAASGLPAHSVRGLGRARDGALLAGGYGHVSRLVGFDAGPRFRSWPAAHGLEGVLVLTATELDDGALLLGTNRGVLVFQPEADGGRGAVSARLGRSSGAIATEVAHSGGFARDAGGRSWFGFKGGLCSFPAGLVAPPGAPPPVEFLSLTSEQGRVFRAPFTAVATAPVGWLGDAAPELPHDDAGLRVTARARSLLDPSDLRFQFRLAGRELDWSEPRAEPFRDLMNLAPGRHVVEVRAGRGGKGWSEPARLAFEVRPAWWQTATFRGMLALALAGALAAAARWRWTAVERRTRRLESQIAERTDDLARYAQALAEHLQTVDRANELGRRSEQARRESFARTSHELRTPLTAILGFSELLERALGERLEGRERRYLANVRDGGESLLRQVNNLLDQFKLEAGRMELHLEQLELGPMIESVLSLMEGYAQHRGVRLELEVEGGMPPVTSDVAKLRQILLNLLANAAKFSPLDAAVTTRVRVLPAGDGLLGAPGYEIAVADRGPGIPAESREAIFEPYRQLGGGAAPGTGLGLPIVRQLVELLGGRIELESEPGQGSTFRVRLPFDPGPRPEDQVEGRESASLDSARPRLLMIEPDRPRFAALARKLELEDLLAVRAAAAEEALRMQPGLRPVAIAARVDPLDRNAWSRVAEVADVARRTAVPLSLLFTDEDGLGFAVSLDRVLAGDDPDAGARAALPILAGDRAVGGTSGRRPMVVVAAERDPGAAFCAALRRAGVEAFRVEGERDVLSAFAESTADGLVLDAAHLVRLAPEVGGGRASPAIAFGRPKLLVTGGRPQAADWARLSERLRTEGGEAGLALAGSARALIVRGSRLQPTEA